MVRSTWPFDWGRRGARITGRIRKAPKSAATSRCTRAGRERGTTIEESRSTTIASGAPPSRQRVPEKAGRKSSIAFEWQNTAA